jgi:hypothetical protein
MVQYLIQIQIHKLTIEKFEDFFMHRENYVSSKKKLKIHKHQDKRFISIGSFTINQLSGTSILIVPASTIDMNP